MSRGGISLRGVTKVYPGGDHMAVDHVDMEIADGEFMVFVGPSGCGKTTLLRMIAGLEEITDGQVMIAGQDKTHSHPGDRDIAMVFQNYALYPHMTVGDNLGFGLRLRKVPKAERQRRIREVAETLGLESYLDRKPTALSGGQRQRVAIGRAIVRDPVAFLMDEPLSNLDAKLRVTMRASLSRLHEQLGVTTILVTHDQVEAMTLGQRVVVLRDGQIQQIDTPQNLFKAPTNLFVASFIGSPSMNLVEAEIADHQIHFADQALPLPAVYQGPSGKVILGIRPTDFEHAVTADPALPRISIRPDMIQELGAQTDVMFSIDAPRVTAEAVQAAADSASEAEQLFTDAGRAQFTAQVDGRTTLRPGQDAEFAIHTAGLHYFDPDTGSAIPVADADARAGQGNPKMATAAG